MTRRASIGVAVLLVVACLLLPFVVSNYRTFQFTLVLVYAIALLGLNILTGYNGQISLGHGAFYAIGAYTAAVLMDRLGAPYWATIPAAGAVCLVAGFLFGLPALRLEGLYLALATFALGVSMPQLLKYHHLEKWTGGVQGIVIAKPEPPAFLRDAGLRMNSDQWLYFFALAVAAVMFVLGWNLLRGRVGRALIAIRDQHIAAEAMGGAGRDRGAVRRARQLHDLPFPGFLGRDRGRRARVHFGRALRRALHPVRAECCGRDLEGRPVGDLRPVLDRLRVLDAGGGRRCRPHAAGAIHAKRGKIAVLARPEEAAGVTQRTKSP